MPNFYPVYVVDDDPDIRHLIQFVCQESDIAATGFENGDALLNALEGLASGCILLDMRMPGKGGLQVQEELKRRGCAMPVIAITGYGDVDMAVQSMKLGALEFLEKPFTNAVLLDALNLAFADLDRAGG